MLRELIPTNGYKRKLARVLVVADGTELVTLRDAANLLLNVLGGNAQSGVPVNATQLLLGASLPWVRIPPIRQSPPAC